MQNNYLSAIILNKGQSKTAGNRMLRSQNNLSYDGEEEIKEGRNSGDTVQKFEFDEIDNANKSDFQRFNNDDRLNRRLR